VSSAPETYFPDGPVAIRDATHDRLAKIGGIRKVLKTRTLPTKDDQLPIICVAHGGENGRPEGDANAGEPKFISDLHLLITIVDRADSDLVLDAGIARKVEEIKRTLFTDPSWLALFEAIESFAVTYHFPREADIVLCEGRMDLTVSYRSHWEPAAFDLEEIVTTLQVTSTADPITIVNEVPTS
jgi:hypothetical protein